MLGEALRVPAPEQVAEFEERVRSLREQGWTFVLHRRIGGLPVGTFAEDPLTANMRARRVDSGTKGERMANTTQVAALQSRVDVAETALRAIQAEMDAQRYITPRGIRPSEAESWHNIRRILRDALPEQEGPA